jgi:hypothetical protein
MRGILYEKAILVGDEGKIRGAGRIERFLGGRASRRAAPIATGVST